MSAAHVCSTCLQPHCRNGLRHFDRLFGKTGSDLKIDIKPVGEINIRAGYQGQNVKNPTLPERARRNGGFDFDANTNFSMNASIGDKLRFPINLNSFNNSFILSRIMKLQNNLQNNYLEYYQRKFILKRQMIFKKHWIEINFNKNF